MKEHQNIEWKETWRDEFLRWICGFANAEGGGLVIGRNDAGQPVGVPDAAILLQDIPNNVRGVLGIMVDVNLRRDAGKDLIEIRVEPYPSPISYKGEYHYRSGSTKQEFIKRREGGIIWNTQGSGKSLIMVWLAKWIREHVTDPRVLIITDRTKLDEQIEKVFKVVLDLRYEARDIDQRITSQAKIDQWFEAKTSGLTDLAKAQLKKRWGTMQKVLSCQDRLEKIVADILLDMETRYRLRVATHEGAGQVVVRNNTTLELRVRPGTDRASRERVLHRWYREHLRKLIPLLLAKWEAALGVQAASWGIKKMKTKWGSCNVEARRIWLNLELAKKPVRCLEYIIAHELTHLLERHHNERFTALMDRHLPTWRLHRQELNSAPLAHEAWGY